ncbi:MAG: hypothetical protein ACHQHN_08040 [Sphingobacteriales bacterium]
MNDANLIGTFVATTDEVSVFLNDFFAKYRSFEIFFRDERQKNTIALLTLEITRMKRLEILETLQAQDYAEGPLSDNLYGAAPMWIFGKFHKQIEIYIKISMGAPGTKVICISFHPSEHPMNYPLKHTK